MIKVYLLNEEGKTEKELVDFLMDSDDTLGLKKIYATEAKARSAIEKFPTPLRWVLDVYEVSLDIKTNENERKILNRLKDINVDELEKISLLGFEIGILKKTPAHWTFYDLSDKNYGAYVGVLCDSGSGLLESTKIGFYLEEEYQRRGLGRKFLEKYIHEVNPVGGIFEARGATNASKALVSGFGFTYLPDKFTWIYKKD
jgi:hypothetical protein